MAFSAEDLSHAKDKQRWVTHQGEGIPLHPCFSHISLRRGSVRNMMIGLVSLTWPVNLCTTQKTNHCPFSKAPFSSYYFSASWVLK